VTSILSSLSLFVSLAALIKTVVERRSPGSFPLLAFVRERFSTAALPISTHMLGLAAGSASILVPFTLFIVLGWVRVQPSANFSIPILTLMVVTLAGRILWAALEELIYRGALLPQISKWSPAWFGIILSAALFAFSHLEGRSANPDGLSLAVFILDGIGFGLVFLASRSLLPALFWHAGKNICIWLLYSQSTLQFAPGIFHAEITGPALWTGSPGKAGLVDVIVTAAIVLAALVISWGSLKRHSGWMKAQ